MYSWLNTITVETAKFDNGYLVVGAVLLHSIRTRNVVEVLAEFCVLPIVNSLARRRTNLKAWWRAQSSWLHAFDRLVGWRHPTQKFIVVWFHPPKVGRLPWPRGDDRQHQEQEKLKCNPVTQVGLTDCLPQRIGFLEINATAACSYMLQC